MALPPTSSSQWIGVAAYPDVEEHPAVVAQERHEAAATAKVDQEVAGAQTMPITSAPSGRSAYAS